MKKKLLTICIPTYNRSIVIKDLIDLLMYQVDKYDDCVVAVSDNSDNDDTRVIIDHYISQYPDKIFYHKNEENIGAFKNLDKAAKLIPSEYIWFLGDDDFVFSYSVSKIRNFIIENKSKKLDFIFLNSCAMDSNLDFIKSPNESNLITDIFYEANNFALFEKFSIASLGHFSRLIFNQENWILHNDISIINQYSYYPQLFTLLNVMHCGTSAFFSSITVINTKRKISETNSGNAWSGLGVVFWTCEFLELKQLLENYTKKKFSGKLYRKNIVLTEWKLSLNREAYSSTVYKQAKENSQRYLLYRLNFFIADICFSSKYIRKRVKKIMKSYFHVNFLNKSPN